jgi:hypothetical protein
LDECEETPIKIHGKILSSLKTGVKTGTDICKRDLRVKNENRKTSNSNFKSFKNL